MAEDTTNRVARDQRVSGQKAILPIVHVPNPPESKPEAMIKIAAEAILHHYQHYDMFAGQLAGSASNASSRGADKVTHNAKVELRRHIGVISS
ncbi:MAG: hypothetical protein IH905_12010 [Proteobacteria bacterium]|nr:hypothetical protein [Pseudomonadota bacterium]